MIWRLFIERLTEARRSQAGQPHHRCDDTASQRGTVAPHAARYTMQQNRRVVEPLHVTD